MSLYDNFRAPQYVDFAGIHGGSEINTDTSSFFGKYFFYYQCLPSI